MAQQHQQQQQRGLGSSGYVSPYFKDSSGNEYESYALAWRYLGIYMDCDSSSDCPRKLLWAAYQDPGYSGGSIGEYQYYDWNYQKWDSSTCQNDRCAEMDCHDVDTETWSLVGVYKESVEFGGDTWFEQLFKHEGFCLWDGDKTNNDDYSNSDYSFMQNLREQWPEDCEELSDIQNYNGQSYYLGTKPLPGGDMTFGIYTDSSCRYESNLSYYDYQKKVSSRSTAKNWAMTFQRWNSLMTAYKICQPCRAYNKVQTYEDRRFLAEYEDGQGEEEQFGYNCYDDADYRNCNQCYKFETHTDMEVASSSDLAIASKQGTILSIQYTDGNWYGSGSAYDEQQSYSYYMSTWHGSDSSATAAGFGVVVVLFGAILTARRLFGNKRNVVAVGTEPTSALRQTLSPSNGVVAA